MNQLRHENILKIVEWKSKSKTLPVSANVRRATRAVMSLVANLTTTFTSAWPSLRGQGETLGTHVTNSVSRCAACCCVLAVSRSFRVSQQEENRPCIFTTNALFLKHRAVVLGSQAHSFRIYKIILSCNWLRCSKAAIAVQSVSQYSKHRRTFRLLATRY